MNLNDKMMNKSITEIGLMLILLMLITCKSPKVTPPNVILIMTDDQGYGDIAANGNPYIKTPELDRLMAESVRLTDFHVNAFCSPTRAALMTGRMSDRTHVRSTVYLRNHLNREETTMAEFFKASGYRTGHFGKWHLGENYPYRPIDRGFDQWVGIGDGGSGTASDYWGNDRMNDHYLVNGKWKPIAGFNTDVFFEETIKFIEQDHSDPFFIYLATNVPHGPMSVLKEWRDEYEDMNFEVKSVPWGDTKDLFASVTRIDWNLGRLRQYLTEKRLDNNTILIFLTDNGSANGTHIFNDNMRGGKGSLYEGGHRVPCIIHWPGGGLNIKKEITHFTSHTDLLPTLIELCKLETPARGHLPFDGRSMVPLLRNRDSNWEDRTFFMHVQNLLNRPLKAKNYLVGTHRWRLINGKQLYDIQKDRGQNDNVFEQHPNVAADLISQYESYWTTLGEMNYPHARPVIGSLYQHETWLNTISWVKSDESPHSWNQRHVLSGAKLSGFWPVEIAEDGLYQFEVRRWPREIDFTMRDSLPLQMESDILMRGRPFRKGKGKAILIDKVRLKVGDQIEERMIGNTEKTVSFDIYLNEGETDIQSWFYTESGDSLSAYYVYVSRLE